MDKELFDVLINSMEEMVAIENGQSQPAAENVHRQSTFHTLPLEGKMDKSQLTDQLCDDKRASLMYGSGRTLYLPA